MVTGPVAFLLSGVIDLWILARYLRRHRAADAGPADGPMETAATHRRARRRGPRILTLIGLAAVSAAITLTGPGSGIARASTTEPSILMDDYAFIYSSPAQVEQNLQQVAQLGVNTIKVSMVWSLVAPDPNSTTEPDFDAASPSAYPDGNWARYDTLVEEAGQLGLTVYFQLTAPAPLWATDPHVSGHDYDWSHDVNPTDFAEFVEAVGARYDGSWPADDDTGSTSTTTTTPTSSLLGTLTAPTSPTTPAAPGPTTIPAVRMWGIWNEPNISAWLSPTVGRVDGHQVLRSPTLERQLIAGAYRSLLETGHGADTILIGETASKGNVSNVKFIDALYCVTAKDQPLRGPRARRLGCPTSSDTRQFVIANPGLFGTTGWAFHPYSFNQAPDKPVARSPTLIDLANIGRLERTLDGAQRAYNEPGGMPIYVTEWGYKSNPPNPFVKTSLLQQETWLDQGWYMSYFMPRIRSMDQELLYDQPPIAGKAKTSAAAWANFDSGLEFQDGSPKPSLAAFRLPIWIPHPHAGPHVTVWAEIRPAQEAGNDSGSLEYRRTTSGPWTAIATLTTTSPEGFILTHVKIPRRGQVRLAWGDPVTQAVYTSRTVSIR